VEPDAAPGTPFLRVGLLYVAGLCAAAQFAKVSVIFETLRAVYPGAGVEIGFLVSLLSLVGIVFGLVAGLVVARLGFRRLLLAALAAGALISLYQSTLPPLPLMLLSRAIEGAAHLAIVVAAPTLITVISAKRHHPVVMTVWSTYFGTAFALAAWVGLPLAAQWGPGALFQLHAGLLALVALLLAVALPREAVATTAGKLSLATVLRRHVEVYTSPTLAAPAAGFGFYALTYVSLLTLLPEHIAPEWRTLVTGMLPLASIAASLVSGATLLRRFRAVTVSIAGFGLGAVLSVLLIAFPGDPALCIALFVALGLMQGASFAAIPELNARPADQALANGALAQTGNMGNTLGTPVLFALGSSGGFPALIGLVALAHATGGLIHFGLARRRDRAVQAVRSPGRDVD